MPTTPRLALFAGYSDGDSKKIELIHINRGTLKKLAWAEVNGFYDSALSKSLTFGQSRDTRLWINDKAIVLLDLLYINLSQIWRFT